jgi:hypothetical protein
VFKYFLDSLYFNFIQNNSILDFFKIKMTLFFSYHGWNYVTNIFIDILKKIVWHTPWDREMYLRLKPKWRKFNKYLIIGALTASLVWNIPSIFTEVYNYGIEHRFRRNKAAPVCSGTNCSMTSLPLCPEFHADLG